MRGVQNTLRLVIKIFLTRADGTSLYFSRDIVYHLFKQENFDWLVDVLGEDHKDHAKILNMF